MQKTYPVKSELLDGFLQVVIIKGWQAKEVSSSGGDFFTVLYTPCQP